MSESISRIGDSSAPPQQHLKFVDGLRGVAILSVVVFHATLYSRGPTDLWWRKITMIGEHGVDLFFVISGLCLAYPTLRALGTNGTFKFDHLGFAAKRLVRIFPPYWATLLLLAAVSGSEGWHQVALHSDAVPLNVSFFDVLRGVFLLDKQPTLSGSFWTLGIELRWYVMFPLALLLFVRSRRAFFASIPALWALCYWSALHVMDALVLPSFLLGIAAAAILLEPPRWIRYAALGFWLALALAIALDASGRGPLWQLAAFCFVLWAIYSERMRRLLSLRALAFVGIASYSIYLIHEPVVAYFDFLGWSPVLSGVGGLLVGIAFWFACERVLMQRDTHRRLVVWTRNLIEHALHSPFPTRPRLPTVARPAADPAP